MNLKRWGVIAALPMMVLWAGCESHGGASQSTGGLQSTDGGVKMLPGETCGATAQCGGGKTYKQCTAPGPPCVGRFITSDNQTFMCTSCTDCMAAAAQVTTWCGGSSVDDSKCKTMTSNACVNCCATDHKTGNDYFNMQLQHCECTSPGACSFECNSTFCLDPTDTSDSLCQSCIQSNATAGGTCDVSAKCMTDTDCAALLTCVQACP
jgi:hypothetical protein